MAKRAAGRAGVGLVVRSFEGKTRKVCVLLRPEDADRLRLVAVGLGVDQGDLVTAGLLEVLRGVEVRVRVLSPGLAPDRAGPDAGVQASEGGPTGRLVG